MQFDPIKFFSFLNFKDGSVRAKWYVFFFKFGLMATILYMVLRPQFKTTQDNDSRYKAKEQTINNYYNQDARTGQNNEIGVEYNLQKKEVTLKAGHRF